MKKVYNPNRYCVARGTTITLTIEDFCRVQNDLQAVYLRSLRPLGTLPALNGIVKCHVRATGFI